MELESTQKSQRIITNEAYFFFQRDDWIKMPSNYADEKVMTEMLPADSNLIRTHSITTKPRLKNAQLLLVGD